MCMCAVSVFISCAFSFAGDLPEEIMDDEYEFTTILFCVYFRLFLYIRTASATHVVICAKVNDILCLHEGYWTKNK